MLKDFDFERFLSAIEDGHAYIDFDASSSHNHGTKFRIRQDSIPDLYTDVKIVVDI